MKQHVSNRLDGDLTAQQTIAETVKMLLATNEALFFWSQGKPVAFIIKGGKSHD